MTSVPDARRPEQARSDQEICRLLNKYFGPGTWVYDPVLDEWIVADPNNLAHGRTFRRFEIVPRSGESHGLRIAASALH